MFPHQLLKDNPCLRKGRKVFLIEDHLYFTQYRFHKMKLLYHRATMKYYEDYLINKGFEVEYVQFTKHQNLKEFILVLSNAGVKAIHFTDTVDFYLEKRLKKYSDQNQIQLIRKESPQFMFNMDDFQDAVDASGKKKYFLTSYYIFQRKRHQILLESDGSPVGGIWTYDTENRSKLPKGIQVPIHNSFNGNPFIDQSKKYVEKNFPNNPGRISTFYYPATFDEARNGLNDFLEKRFLNYGVYQDAIDQRDPFLFHSMLSAPLNCGLITPEYIIEKTLQFAEVENIPLNSLEGFIRQIIGWREFFRGIYIEEGIRIRNSNFFNHTRSIPDSFYTATTGIVPLDDTINKVINFAYAHHIERLMIAGNFMLLCEFHPDEVYRWFMELFIDAYDWVMVPNVYSMSQYADGGLLTTKPYISGSNYIHKMSSYKKGDWSQIWDALYWRFLYTHKEELSKNIRMKMVYSLLGRMDNQKLKDHLKTGNDYLGNL